MFPNRHLAEPPLDDVRAANAGWHRCSRWWTNRLECPYAGPGHEPQGDDPEHEPPRELLKPNDPLDVMEAAQALWQPIRVRALIQDTEDISPRSDLQRNPGDVARPLYAPTSVSSGKDVFSETPWSSPTYIPWDLHQEVRLWEQAAIQEFQQAQQTQSNSQSTRSNNFKTAYSQATQTYTGQLQGTIPDYILQGLLTGAAALATTHIARTGILSLGRQQSSTLRSIGISEQRLSTESAKQANARGPGRPNEVGRQRSYNNFMRSNPTMQATTQQAAVNAASATSYSQRGKGKGGQQAPTFRGDTRDPGIIDPDR